MQEQIISFKTAKLANEVGFKTIQTFGNSSSLYDVDGKQSYYQNYGFMGSGYSDGYISAPTQSLLQKWLREEHKIHVEPFVNSNDENEYLVKIINFNITDSIDIIKNKNRQLPSYWSSHEQALEQGLEEALLLIKEK